MSDLKIKSRIRDYDVFFGRTITDSFHEHLNSDDTIIIEPKVFSTFGNDDQKIIIEHNHW